MHLLSYSPKGFVVFFAMLFSTVSVLAALAVANAPQGAAPGGTNATLGAFITPVEATAQDAQSGAGRTPSKTIDGSGWGETFPGSAVFVASSNIWDGNNMWNGQWNSWLQFDLGKTYRVAGLYAWNYNEPNWTNRGIKDMTLSSSTDGLTFAPVGDFTLLEAPGKDDYQGQALAFKAPVTARYFKVQIQSNYRGGEQSGLAEIRFANADEKAPGPHRVVWTPKYERPRHPKLAPAALFPADAGVIDVTSAPYNAKGDGVTDDTAAIQKALNDNPDRGATIYFPNGIYLVSDTLRWGKNERNTVFWGQSRVGTVLKLKDSCPGYANPRQPKAVIWTGNAPAQRFSNEIHSLTVDTGSGNPAACGVQFIANNQGGVTDVTIVSGDGQGVNGLDLGFSDEQGPCLIENVLVRGFDYGVRCAKAVDGETLEHVKVEYQNIAGFCNDGQPFTARDLESFNDVPAFLANGGLNVLIDCQFKGTGAALSQPALRLEGTLMARNLKTTGYKRAIENRAGDKKGVEGAGAEFFLSRAGANLFGGEVKPLNLPIQETPTVAWDPLDKWKAPQAFGAKSDDGQDDSAAIQKAIDSGATTVYLPRGSYDIGDTIVIRGQVRRLIGCRAWLNTTDALRAAGKPVFRFEEGAAPVVIVEGMSTDFSGGTHCFLENTARRTLVLHRLAINFQGADAYRGHGGGQVFIEDVVGHNFRFQSESVWARQFNVEGGGIHVSNQGGKQWILGYKTEGGGTLHQTTAEGITELLGGMAYSSGQNLTTPMFIVDGGRATFSFCEIDFGGGHFHTILRDTQGGETRELKDTDTPWQGQSPLLMAGR